MKLNQTIEKNVKAKRYQWESLKCGSTWDAPGGNFRRPHAGENRAEVFFYTRMEKWKELRESETFKLLKKAMVWFRVPLTYELNFLYVHVACRDGLPICEKKKKNPNRL